MTKKLFKNKQVKFMTLSVVALFIFILLITIPKVLKIHDSVKGAVDVNTRTEVNHNSSDPFLTPASQIN